MNTVQTALSIVTLAVMIGFFVLLFEVVGSALLRLLGRVKHKSWSTSSSWTGAICPRS